ncbi:MAG: CPXCG motif-containing cysteine-rich protein [Granulosicoccaceae bacterium]
MDLSGGDQDYIEDCRVCCRPIECRLRVISDEGYSLETRRDNE